MSGTVSGRSEGDGESLYELRLLRNALTLSMESFNADPASFPQQLCGRLLPFIGDDFTRCVIISQGRNWLGY